MTKLTLLIAVLLVCSTAAFSQAVVTGKSISVVKFDITKGVEFPATSMDTMMTEIVDELTKLKKFQSVTSIDSSDAAVSDLVLTGTVTRFEAGNRAARYFIGFGAGKTKVVANVKIIDKQMGNVLMSKTVDGRVVMGLFGGNSNGITRGLAKEVAKETKKNLFK